MEAKQWTSAQVDKAFSVDAGEKIYAAGADVHEALAFYCRK